MVRPTPPAQRDLPFLLSYRYCLGLSRIDYFAQPAVADRSLSLLPRQIPDRRVLSVM